MSAKLQHAFERNSYNWYPSRVKIGLFRLSVPSFLSPSYQSQRFQDSEICTPQATLFLPTHPFFESGLRWSCLCSAATFRPMNGRGVKNCRSKPFSWAWHYSAVATSAPSPGRSPRRRAALPVQRHAWSRGPTVFFPRFSPVCYLEVGKNVNYCKSKNNMEPKIWGIC